MLDLVKLRAVAETGDPAEAVPVTRRWLRQALNELLAARMITGRATLDLDPPRQGSSAK